ncbi:MAG: hypothetical protein M1823_001261 [Watsoniomyces obsoletus]|nr:MAG: hypothetical protein M1823_001261 [Watsoniomyces obsoletus]
MANSGRSNTARTYSQRSTSGSSDGQICGDRTRVLADSTGHGGQHGKHADFDCYVSPDHTLERGFNVDSVNKVAEKDGEYGQDALGGSAAAPSSTSTGSIESDNEVNIHCKRAFADLKRRKQERWEQVERHQWGPIIAASQAILDQRLAEPMTRE